MLHIRTSTKEAAAPLSCEVYSGLHTARGWPLLHSEEAGHVNEVLATDDVVSKPDHDRRAVSNLHKLN